jgi:hypothetical protein
MKRGSPYVVLRILLDAKGWPSTTMLYSEMHMNVSSQTEMHPACQGNKASRASLLQKLNERQTSGVDSLIPCLGPLVQHGVALLPHDREQSNGLTLHPEVGITLPCSALAARSHTRCRYHICFQVPRRVELHQSCSILGLDRVR